MKRTLLPLACAAAALALAAPAALAKGGDDGPGDDHGKDASANPALVTKSHDAPGTRRRSRRPARSRHPQSRGDGGTAGVCTIRSTSKLKANPPRNGRIQVEFEVESHVVGQVWKVQLKDNGAIFLSRNATTLAPGGSFEARAFAKNQIGTDTISASATNAATGESCTASVSV